MGHTAGLVTMSWNTARRSSCRGLLRVLLCSCADACRVSRGCGRPAWLGSFPMQTLPGPCARSTCLSRAYEACDDVMEPGGAIQLQRLLRILLSSAADACRVSRSCGRAARMCPPPGQAWHRTSVQAHPSSQPVKIAAAADLLQGQSHWHLDIGKREH